MKASLRPHFLLKGFICGLESLLQTTKDHLKTALLCMLSNTMQSSRLTTRLEIGSYDLGRKACSISFRAPDSSPAPVFKETAVRHFHAAPFSLGTKKAVKKDRNPLKKALSKDRNPYKKALTCIVPKRHLTIKKSFKKALSWNPLRFQRN